MFCPRCGKEALPGSRFCVHCGTRLIDPDEIPALFPTEPETPAPAEPTVPAAAAPAEPEAAAPVEPAAPAPIEPEAAAPAEPEAAAPVEPEAAAAPVEPAAASPVEPAAAAPVEPEVPAPVESVAPAPAEPEAASPAEPEAAAPAEPTAPEAAAPAEPVPPVPQPPVTQPPVTPPAPVQQPVQEKKKQKRKEVRAQARAAAQAAAFDQAPLPPLSAVPQGGYIPPVGAPAKPKKKRKVWLIVLIAVLAVLLLGAAVFVGVKFLLPASSGEEVYFFLSEGQYEMFRDLRGGDPIEVAPGGNPQAYSNLVYFSPDGEYLYYITDLDADKGSGKLCRAEFRQLRKDPKRNEEYLTTVASDVSPDLWFLSDGSFVYRTGGNDLYYSTGEEQILLARGVLDYMVDSETARVLYTVGVFVGEPTPGGYPDQISIYGISLEEPKKVTELASEAAYLCYAEDFDNIVFARNGAEGYSSLCMVDFAGHEKILAEVGFMEAFEDGKLYFSTLNGKTLNLYDYTDDPYTKADALLKEPQEEDYSTPVYTYAMISLSEPKEEDYEELYTSCTQPLYWYGESTRTAYSMKDSLARDWGDNPEAVREATQKFIEDFGDQADEEGWIPVTDEVKAALQEINQAAEGEERQERWLWLCRNKYQSDVSVNYEEYDKAYNAWAEAEERNRKREMLKDPANAYPLKDLYCFENGVSSLKAEDVVWSEVHLGGLLYNTVDQVTGKMDINGIYIADDLNQLFDLDPTQQNKLLVFSNGSTCQLSATAAEAYAAAVEKNDFATLHCSTAEVFLDETDGRLSVAPIKNGTVGEFTLIDDSAVFLDADGADAYYAVNVNVSGDLTYEDFCFRSEGQVKVLAKGIIGSGTLRMYEDGKIIATTGYREGSGYQFSLFDGESPEGTVLTENASQCIRLQAEEEEESNSYLFVSGGNLIYFNGKEEKLLAENVEMLWCRNSMGTERTFGGSGLPYYYHCSVN